MPSARNYLTKRAGLSQEESLYASAFALVGNAEENDPAAFAKYAEWISSIRLMIEEGGLTTAVVKPFAEVRA